MKGAADVTDFHDSKLHEDGGVACRAHIRLQGTYDGWAISEWQPLLELGRRLHWSDFVMGIDVICFLELENQRQPAPTLGQTAVIQVSNARLRAKPAAILVG